MFVLSFVTKITFVLVIATTFCTALIIDDLVRFMEPFSQPSMDTRSFVTPPEAALSAVEIIRYHGYSFERHVVETSDGYLLEVHRIPNGRKKRGTPRGEPIYVQHGLLGNSGNFLVNGVRNSLAFNLADEGYDVWLGNLRGNTYSRQHRRLSEIDPLFWEFKPPFDDRTSIHCSEQCLSVVINQWLQLQNVDDHGLKDVPAMIDYILAATGEKQLICVGHSLGATSILSMLSGLPEYNEKIKIAVCLAPVVYVRYMRTAARVGLNFIEKLKSIILPISSTKEIFRSSMSQQQFGRKMCTSRDGNMICEALVHLIAGYDEDLLDRNRLSVMARHVSGTSVNVLDHFAQLFRADKPVRYDYGRKRNLQEYGTVLPPDYNVTRVSAPVAIFWGYMDAFTDKKDLDRLAARLQNLHLYEMVPFDLWSHIDFIYAKNARTHLYDRLLQVVNQFNSTLIK